MLQHVLHGMSLPYSTFQLVKATEVSMMGLPV